MVVSYVSWAVLAIGQTLKVDELSEQFLAELPKELFFIRSLEFKERHDWKVTFGDPKGNPTSKERVFNRYFFTSKKPFESMLGILRASLTSQLGWSLKSEGGGIENMRARRKRSDGVVDYVVDLYPTMDRKTSCIFIYDESKSLGIGPGWGCVGTRTSCPFAE